MYQIYDGYSITNAVGHLKNATIPKAYTRGKSLVGIAAGNYQGQNGLAARVGYQW